MSREPPARHTPGPWSVRLNQWSRWEIHYANGNGKGQLAGVSMPDDPCSPPSAYPECEANARLIAAAPDMLAALLTVTANLPVNHLELHTVVNAAIAKAQP